MHGIVLALLLTVRTLFQRLVAKLLDYFKPSAIRALVLINWHTTLTTLEEVTVGKRGKAPFSGSIPLEAALVLPSDSP